MRSAEISGQKLRRAFNLVTNGESPVLREPGDDRRRERVHPPVTLDHQPIIAGPQEDPDTLTNAADRFAR